MWAGPWELLCACGVTGLPREQSGAAAGLPLPLLFNVLVQRLQLPPGRKAPHTLFFCN